jgi:hypothetical protein
MDVIDRSKVHTLHELQQLDRCRLCREKRPRSRHRRLLAEYLWRHRASLGIHHL